MKPRRIKERQEDIIAALKSAFRDIRPAIAGCCSQGTDIDVLAVLDFKKGSMPRFMSALDRIMLKCDKTGGSVVVFRSFVRLPLLIQSRNILPTPTAIHLLLYPDAFSALAWESSTILASIARKLELWEGNPDQLTRFQAMLIPDHPKKMIYWYRSLLYDVVQSFMCETHDSGLTVQELLHRFRYILKYSLLDRNMSAAKQKQYYAPVKTLFERAEAMYNCGKLIGDARHNQVLIDLIKKLDTFLSIMMRSYE